MWNSPESKQEYARVIAEFSTSGGTAVSPSKMTVNELMVQFMRFAKSHYPSKSRIDAFCAAIKPVRELYGLKLATEFGPLALKVCRDRYMNCNIVRNGENRRVSDIKHIFNVRRVSN